MMLPRSTVPYPRQDEIDANEDGVGFALRLATLNGLTFNDLARRFASAGHLYLPARTSSSLAFIFGCTPARLAPAFVRRYFRGSACAATFLDQDFLRAHHLRQTHPQICPECLREKQITLAAWSISLVTCCPVHAVRLIDRCVCGRAISWRRPAIDFCECSRRLTSSQQRCETADQRETAIAGQITYLLGPAHFRLRTNGSLPAAFDDVSIDTFLRLVWAFGIITDDQFADHPRSANRMLTTTEAAALVCRAYSRLVLITSLRPSTTLQPRVAAQALTALLADCEAPADIQLVEAIRRRLQGTGRREIPRRRSDTNVQLSLFEDCHA
jgi:hypothetical protein